MTFRSLETAGLAGNRAKRGARPSEGMTPWWPMGLLGLLTLPIGWLTGQVIFSLWLTAGTATWYALDTFDASNLLVSVAVFALAAVWVACWRLYLRRADLSGPGRAVTKWGLPVALIFIATQAFLSAKTSFDVF